MSLQSIITAPFRGFAAAANVFTPVFDLAIRVWVSWVFFKSGLSKIQSWDSTVMLFEYEYEVPLLEPKMAALLGTGAELILPVLLALGFMGRVSAFGLFVLNIVAVYAYGSFLFSDEGTVGLLQHYFWGVAMLVSVFHGPGKLSVDYLLGRRFAD